MRVYLIGMPGSGKTTVGKIVAQHLNYKFVDLDDEIEKDSLMFIPEIFSKYGEERFRQIETSILAKTIDDNTVISCGGGIVTREENKHFMDGLIFWLDVELHNLEKRIDEDNISRPLLQTNTLLEIYNKRQKMYKNFAQYRVTNNNITETAKKIVEVVQCAS